MTNKIAPRRDAVATDRNGAEIRNGDTVREVYGEQRSGVILHIHRSFLFLHNKTQAEDAGIIVVRATNVVTVSAKGGRATGPDLSKMNPALNRNGMGSMPPPKRFGRDRLIEKTVLVRKGPFKGLVGIVKDAGDEQARVELHSKNKLVTIPKEILVVKECVLILAVLSDLTDTDQSGNRRYSRYVPWWRRGSRPASSFQRIRCAAHNSLARWAHANGCGRLFANARMGWFHVS